MVCPIFLQSDSVNFEKFSVVFELISDTKWFANWKWFCLTKSEHAEIFLQITRRTVSARFWKFSKFPIFIWADNPNSGWIGNWTRSLSGSKVEISFEVTKVETKSEKDSFFMNQGTMQWNKRRLNIWFDWERFSDWCAKLTGATTMVTKFKNRPKGMNSTVDSMGMARWGVENDGLHNMIANRTAWMEHVWICRSFSLASQSVICSRSRWRSDIDFWSDSSVEFSRTRKSVFKSWSRVSGSISLSSLRRRSRTSISSFSSFDFIGCWKLRISIFLIWFIFSILKWPDGNSDLNDSNSNLSRLKWFLTSISAFSAFQYIFEKRVIECVITVVIECNFKWWDRNNVDIVINREIEAVCRFDYSRCLQKLFEISYSDLWLDIEWWGRIGDIPSGLEGTVFRSKWATVQGVAGNNMTVQTNGVIEIDFEGFQKCLLITKLLAFSKLFRWWSEIQMIGPKLKTFLKPRLRNGRVGCRTFLRFQLDLIH